MTTNDSILIEDFRSGHNRSFDMLMSKYRSKIFGHMMSKVHDMNIADDLTQEITIKVMNKILSGKYKDEKTFEKWLTVLSYNHHLDYVRKLKRDVKIVLVEDDDDYGNPDVPSVEVSYIKEKMIVDMNGMIELLPAEQRLVVVLRKDTDLAFKDIANLTGDSVHTVQGRMRYALINLRKMMNRE